MEVVVLPPQNCLQRHHRHHHNHHRRNPNLRKPIRSNPRRQNSKSPPPPSTGPAQAHTQTRPITGQIRVLRRGEDIVKLEPHTRPVIGPMFYAGSACVTSPPPSELPLPAFFTRSCALSSFSDVNNQKIASDLRRVLKLC